MFLKHLFNYSIFISVSASWLNGYLVCMVLLVELDVLFWPQRLVFCFWPQRLVFNVPPLDEFKGKNEVSTVSLPLLFAVTLSIITSNIYTRLAACKCISITFWSGDLPSPLMAIFLLVVCMFFYIHACELFWFC